MTPAPSTPRPVVVHIDDNEGDRELVRIAAEDCCGPQVDYRGIGDGAHALEELGALMQPGGPAISLILLDVNMPRIDGWQLVSFIHGQPALQGVPLVVLSGSSSSRDVERAKQAGVAFRTKPTTFGGLSRMLSEILASGDAPAPA